MTESDFIGRLIMIVIMGLLFIFAFLNRASYNVADKRGKTPLFGKVLGWILCVLSVLQLAGSIFWLLRIDFPTDSLIAINRNSIIRPPSVSLIWGYPTSQQLFSLNMFTGFFACLAFGLYFLKFKKSNTKVIGKIGKFSLYLVAWVLFVSSSDIHYLDFWDIAKPIMFIIVIAILFRPKNKDDKKTTSLQSAQPSNIVEVRPAETDKVTDVCECIVASNTVEKETDTTCADKPKDTKPYFKVFTIISFSFVLLGNIFFFSFKHTGINIETSDSYSYSRHDKYNSDDYKNSVVVKDYDRLNGGVNGNVQRAAPFDNLQRVMKMGDGESGFLVYESSYNLNDSDVAKSYLDNLFTDSEEFGSGFFTDWNCRVLNRPAFSYYFYDYAGIYKTAVVLTHWDKIILILTEGESMEECNRKINSIVSSISLYDYNHSPSISAMDFTRLNVSAMILSLLIFFLGIFLQLKQEASWKSSANKRSRFIIILNSCYVAGWIIFVSLLTTQNCREVYEELIWPLLILFLAIATILFGYQLKVINKPTNEFYLIPHWLKSKFAIYGLNTQLVYRLLLLFLLWPFYYLALLPVVGFIPCIYVASVAALIGLLLIVLKTIKWIKAGKGIKVE